MTDTAVARASMLRQSGRPEEALRTLMPHLASHPDDAEALRQASWAHLALDDLPAAYANSYRGVSLAPSDPDQHLLMASVLVRQGHFPLARQAAEAAIKLAPHSPVCFQVAAAIDVQAKMVTEQTLWLAHQAVSLDPHDGDAHRILGQVLVAQKRFDEARVEFGQALAIEPGDMAAANELARADLAQGRTGSAATAYTRALRSDPTNAVLAFNLKVAAFNAFARAHLVLWVGFFLLTRIGLFDGSGSDTDAVESPMVIRIAAPVIVVLALAMWAYQLRHSKGSMGAIARAVAADWALRVGVGAHFLCMALFLVSAVLPEQGSTILLIIGAIALVTASIFTWVIKRRFRRSRP